MISNKLRALGTALFLGTAVVAVGSLPLATPVEAAARAVVGKALQEAIRMAESGNISGANAKVREAEGAGGLTSGDQQAIEQTKQYIAAKSGTGGGSKNKFISDYDAGRYHDVVGADADELRRSGGFDGQAELLVAQAYYQMGDCSEAIRILREMHSENAVELMMSCAYKSGDHAAMRDAAEQLVVSFNQPKYWVNLLSAADSTPGMSPENTMDVYRIRLLTNSMRNGDDYTTAAEVAIQIGNPTEAQGLVQKGMDAKLLNDDRTVRLMNMAKGQAVSEAANLQRVAAAAAAAKNGDPDLKLSEEYWGMGRYQDALDAAKAGIAKGLTNPALGQIRLAMAYIGLHQRDAAVHALNQVSNAKPSDTAVAHLWSVYARTH